MNNFARAHDRYLEPPDDDPICEDACGQTLERDIEGEWVCVNRFCPTKFQGVEKEMAEALVDALDAADDLRILKRRYLALNEKYEAEKRRYNILLEKVNESLGRLW